MPDWSALWRAFWSRPSAERVRLLRSAWRHFNQHGLRSSASRIGLSSDLAASRAEEQVRYQQWIRQHAPGVPELAEMRERAASFAYRPLITVLTPVYNTEPRLLAACAQSVIGQVYERWEWRIGNDGSTRPETLECLRQIAEADRRVVVHTMEQNGGISAASNLALAHSAGEFVALLDHDDALAPHALFRVVEHLNEVSELPDVVYSDEDKFEVDGTRSDAYFKPDWSPELLLANMYACHLLVLRRDVINDVGGFRSEFDFSQDHDLLLRISERANRVDHVSDVLYHWRKSPESAASVGSAKPTAHLAGRKAVQDHLDRNGIKGRVEDAGPPGFHRPVFDVSPARRVSIVAELERDERAALIASTDYPDFEIVRTAPEATGSLLLFLDPELSPLDSGWLDAMVQWAAQPGIGAVGAKILRADTTVEHLGLALGLCGFVGRPLLGARSDHPGYFGSALAARPVTAISGACLMTTADLYRNAGVGEFASREAMAVDYCLQMAALGLRVVVTPFARLKRRVAAPVPEIPPSDQNRLRARWNGRLDRDPYYNRNLSRDALDYRVAL